jgi:hypothetical protein
MVEYKKEENLTEVLLKRKKELEKMPTPERSRLLRHSNISLILDSYDDLFSDFDPRQYSDKALSDDFLSECKRAAREKPHDGEIELILQVPKDRRKYSDEATIRKRMKDHFHKHYQEMLKDAKRIRKEGALWLFAGAMLVLTATAMYERTGFLSRLMIVLLEPAGWFTMWTGFDKAFIDPKEKIPDMEFYKKMVKVEIKFEGY